LARKLPSEVLEVYLSSLCRFIANIRYDSILIYDPYMLLICVYY
jgi:hypothetical protein